MKKQNRLPDVIFMSQKASELLKTQITEVGACIEYDGTGIDINDLSSFNEDVDNRSIYRNISQLWHPADEQPNCIGPILCWCSNGTFFVHHHYSYIYEHWHLFVSVNNVKRYCYIANLRKDMYF